MADKFDFGFKPILGDLLPEPSGVIQLDDDRFLAINDEIENIKEPLFLLNPVQTDQLFAERLPLPPLKLDDLEGLALLGDFVYGITSFSKDEDARRRLVRFQIPPNSSAIRHMESAEDCDELIDRVWELIGSQHQEGRASFESNFNIEGLAAHSEAPEKELYIGLRSPLVSKTADGEEKLLAAVVKTKEILKAFGEKSKSLKLSDQYHLLDMKGGGIRAMTWVDSWKKFLLVSGKAGDENESSFKCEASDKKSKFLLWFWDGVSESAHEILCFPKKFRGVKTQPEGITPVRLPDNKETLMFVSDDGDEYAFQPRPGRYWQLSGEEYKNLKDEIDKIEADPG